MRRRDKRIGVRRVADHHHPDVVGGARVEGWRPVSAKMAALAASRSAAFHARGSRGRAPTRRATPTPSKARTASSEDVEASRGVVKAASTSSSATPSAARHGRRRVRATAGSTGTPRPSSAPAPIRNSARVADLARRAGDGDDLGGAELGGNSGGRSWAGGNSGGRSWAGGGGGRAGREIRIHVWTRSPRTSEAYSRTVSSAIAAASSWPGAPCCACTTTWGPALSRRAAHRWTARTPPTCTGCRRPSRPRRRGRSRDRSRRGPRARAGRRPGHRIASRAGTTGRC